MLKTITLGLAERVLIARLLDSGSSGEPGVARTVRALRQDLQIRAAAQQAAEEFGDRTWDDLLDAGPAKEYTTDETHLLWLRDSLQRHGDKWSKVRAADGKEVEVPIPAGQLEAIANLADALSAALAG